MSTLYVPCKYVKYSIQVPNIQYKSTQMTPPQCFDSYAHSSTDVILHGLAVSVKQYVHIISPLIIT